MNLRLGAAVFLSSAKNVFGNLSWHRAFLDRVTRLLDGRDAPNRGEEGENTTCTVDFG